MAELDLVGVHSRKKWRRGRLDVAPAPDLLKRDFSASRPDERWVADITEFMTGEGKLFLAGVKDLYGRGLARRLVDGHSSDLGAGHRGRVDGGCPPGPDDPAAAP
jgi:transposase InsO family protein